MSLVRLIKPVAALAVGFLAVGIAGASPASAAARKPRLPIALTSQPGNPSTTGTATFGWTPTAGATYTCAIDGGAGSACSSPKAYAGLLDGTHTFVLKGRLGGYRSGSSIVTWVVDTTPPRAPSVAPVATPTRSTSAVISFTNADPTAVAHTCALDGAAATSCTSPWQIAGPLAEGPHSVTVQSVDVSGVVGGTTTVPWTVDLTAPANVVLVGPGSPTASNSATFTFSAPGATSFLCALDGGPGVACTSPHVLSGVTDGSHTMVVSASDGAGNLAQPATAIWAVDTASPPGPTFLTGPATPTNQTTAHFVVNNPDGSAQLLCRRDSTSPGDWVACPSPLSLTGFTAGVHSLDVRAVDTAGNESLVSTAHWTVDLSVPAPARFVSGPRSPNKELLPEFDFVSTDGSSFGFRCSLDSADPADYVDCDIDTVPLGLGVTQGNHVLRVIALDEFNAQSSPVAWTWTTDRTAPAQPAFTNKPDLSTTATSATFAFTSELGAAFGCALDGATAAPCTSPVTFSGLALGSHSFVVTATDAAGNASQSTYGWTVVAPPVVTPTGVTPTDVTPTVVTPTGVTPPVVTPPVVVLPAAPAAPAATSASISISRALKGRSTVAFSSNVRNVSAASVRLLPAGGSAASVALACAAASGSATDCSGIAVRTVTVTPTRPLVPGQSYTLALGGVTDTSGTPVTGSQSFRASTDEQETSLAATHRWRTTKAAKALGRSYLVENRKGASVTYAFTGNQVTWYTLAGPSQGRAVVYVDGVLKARVNNWAPVNTWRVARTVKGLKSGSHQLRIVVTGRKGATSGTGTNVVVDGAKVGAKIVNSPRTTMAWRHPAAAAASGKAYSVSRLAGATTAFTFRGTSVTWVTQTGPAMGKAKVYVDGVLKASVDNFAKRGKWNVRRTVSGLAAGTHTVSVVVSGAKRRASKGTDVVVDRWLVG